MEYDWYSCIKKNSTERAHPCCSTSADLGCAYLWAMLEYKHWGVTIKEKGNPESITTEMHGCYDENDVVKFYGLKNDDVEWYKLKEL